MSDDRDQSGWTFTRADLAAAFAAQLGPDWPGWMERRLRETAEQTADLLRAVRAVKRGAKTPVGRRQPARNVAEKCQRQ